MKFLILKNIGSVVFAEDSLGQSLITNVQNFGQTDASQGFEHVVSRFMIVAAMFGVVALTGIFIAAGYKLATSQGDAEKLKDAQSMLTNGIIGFLMVVFAVAIMYMISSLLQVQTS